MAEFNLEYDATPSWSGYNYQGKIALYVLLTELCELYRANQVDKIEDYKLELEWMEDFSILIRENNVWKYNSIHQVKAYDTDNINNYSEALFGLTIKTINNLDIKQAYLHTWKQININSDDWYSKIKTIVIDQSNQSEIVNELVTLRDNQNKLEEAVQRLLKPKCGKVPGYLKRILVNLDDEDEINEINVLKAVKQALQLTTLNAFDIQSKLSDNILKKIKLFNYNGLDFCDLEDIKSKIKEKIKLHLELQDNYLATDSQYCEIIYLYLLGEIDKNITARHKTYNSKNKLAISFVDINNILKSKTLSEYSREYYLLKLKDKFFDFYLMYCKACLKKDTFPEVCKNCNLAYAIRDIEKMNINEFEKFCRVLCPDVIGKIEDPLVFQKILESGGVNGSLFKGLREIERTCQKSNGTFRYQSIDSKTLLLTALEDKSIDCSSSFACTNILKNKAIDGIFMDIDELISKDFDEVSIWDCANKITQFSMDDTVNGITTFDHICHCKNTSLVNVNDVIRRLKK
jgi:hypothetical protein